MVNSVNGQTGAVTGIATASDVDALEARVDNIVAPQGDPSLTEVSDARVGVDGTTYSTLKGRIDGEVDELNERLDSEIADERDDLEDRLMEFENSFKNPEFLSIEFGEILISLLKSVVYKDSKGKQYYDILKSSL